MTKYIALLRGINVGGHNLIKMEQLRDICSLPGFSNVATYIQSGNLLFDTKEQDQEKLISKISKQLQKELGYELNILLRSKDELAHAVSRSPFDEKENEVLYVFFLPKELTAEQEKLVPSLDTEYITYKAQGRQIYCLCKKVNGQSNFSNALLERKLKVAATARNMTTLKKILLLSEN